VRVRCNTRPRLAHHGAQYIITAASPSSTVPNVQQAASICRCHKSRQKWMPNCLMSFTLRLAPNSSLGYPFAAITDEDRNAKQQ